MGDRGEPREGSVSKDEQLLHPWARPPSGPLLRL